MYLLWAAIFSFVCTGVFGKQESQKFGDVGNAIAQGMKDLKEKEKYDAFLLESEMADRDKKDKKVNDTIKTFDQEERKRLFDPGMRSFIGFNRRF